MYNVLENLETATMAYNVLNAVDKLVTGISNEVH